MQTRVAVAGAGGRLGRLICEVVEGHPDFSLTERLGRASGEAAWQNADVLIDATTPEASPDIVRAALARGQRVIVATSGWSEDKLAVLREVVAASDRAAVLIVPNFSLGSVLGSALSRIAAPFFDAVEIIESHHEHKIDSPSGTAVRTAELIAEARQGRELTPPFAEQVARGEVIAGVPVHSLRLSGVVAQQEVRFGGVGETLTIAHHTVSNDSYRAGVRAAIETISDLDGLTVGLDSILGIAK